MKFTQVLRIAFTTAATAQAAEDDPEAAKLIRAETLRPNAGP
jgi:hypothetical protein